MICFYIIIFSIIVIDQVIKLFIEANIHGESIEIIENIFNITYLQNRGAAWGILSDRNWILLIIAPILIACVLIYIYKFKSSKLETIASGFIIGGAMGNYLDRIFRGYVVDYIDFRIWPIFNFADVCIVIGCTIFIINLTRNRDKSKP